jgi:hypothetical protein
MAPVVRRLKDELPESYDKWFQNQVEIGLIEADNPNTVWVPHKIVKKDIAKQSASLQARIKRTTR